MFLRFDRGNYQALKVLICSALGGKQVTTEEDSTTTSTCFRVSKCGNRVFSMNAAAVFVLGLRDDQDLDYWLEWEASYLAPLVHLVVLGHFNKKLNLSLMDALKKAILMVENEVLTSHQELFPFFWSSIHPVIISKVVSDFDTEFSKTSKWFKELAAHPAYKTAAAKVFPKEADKLLKESLQRAPMPDFVLSEADSTDTQVSSGPTNEEIEKAFQGWLNAQWESSPPREHPILPVNGRRNLLITSALPYVNNTPHLGNIIGCVLSADVFSRFCRLRGYNSLYVCGTDEYGTATETKALQEGMTPEQICDKYHALHADIYKWFNIDFDSFGRTTTSNQTKISQDIFWKVYKKGYVTTESVEQLKCEKCDRFLADRFVEGVCPLCSYEDARGDQCDKCGKLINAIDLIKPRCKLCQSPPIIKSSDHLFLDLPKLQDRLTDYLKSAYQTGTWTSNAKQITQSWLKDGLKTRCITRDLKWGTPVPLEGFTDKVFYVWFDAPIGYISITANYTDQWEQWWKNPKQVEMYNFMAKDNVPFHSVIFPCTLIGADADFTIVNHLCATEYLNYENDKFSKSRGVGVFGDNAKTTGIPADIWRFYLLYVRPESQDSTFSWDDFMLKNNSELLNNLGNFVNRALKFVNDTYGGVVPEMNVIDEDKLLFAQITTELNEYIENLEQAQLREGIWHILNISRLGNQYIQSSTPWKLAKSESETDRKRAAAVVGIAANVACLLSVLVHPYMPEVSRVMCEQMNVKELCKLDGVFKCQLPSGHKIGKPFPLFAKIDSKLIEDLKQRFAGTPASKPAPPVSKPAPPVSKPTEKSSSDRPAADPQKAEQLAKEVEAQGNKVRELKTSKAEKLVIDQEVAALLNLKRQLAIAEGRDPDEKPKGKGKGKGKKK